MSIEASTLSLNTEQHHHHHYANNAVTVTEANNKDIITSTAMPTTATMNSSNTTPSTKELSKLILRTALQKANMAVQCDSTNNVLGAITAYKEAVSLLDRVLITADNEGDRQRLQNIHDSYSERIVLLSAITSTNTIQPQTTGRTIASTSHLSNEEDDSSADAAPSRLVSQHGQKEKMTTMATITKNSALPPQPPAQIQASKSTPTITATSTAVVPLSITQQQQIQPNTNGHERKASLTEKIKKVATDKEDQKKDKGKPERPPRFSSRLRSGSISTSTKEQQHQAQVKSSKRSSACSVDSSISIDSNNQQQAAQQQQKAQAPAMILSSLVQSNSNTTSASTTKKVVSSLFRSTTRNSSLHMKKSPSSTSSASASTTSFNTTHNNDTLPPATIPVASSHNTSGLSMQRSSSMSTVEQYTLLNDPSTQPYSPQMLINRPSVLFSSSASSSPNIHHVTSTKNNSTTTSTANTALARPSLNSGLGSMRRKAANRLSMDGLMGKNKSSHNYQTFLKDHIEQEEKDVFTTDATATATVATTPTATSPTAANKMKQSPSSMSVASSLTSPTTSTHAIPTMTITTTTTPVVKESTSYSQQYLKLLLAIEKSMLEGAYLTQKLYIPKNLWQQPNIRLSSMDVKISACESIMNDMTRLENWIYLDDLTSSIRIIQQLETTVDQLQTTLAKKLKRESTPASDHSLSSGSSTTSSSSGGSTHQQAQQSQQQEHHASSSSNMSHSRDSMSMSVTSSTTNESPNSTKKTQSFISWGSKITKSVERMNGAFSLTGSNKTEDQFRNYVDVLQKLFAKLHVLEYWLNHYYVEKKNLALSTAATSAASLPLPPQYDILIMKLIKICTVLNNMIGGFVVRDITILLAKWLKRGSSWVNE